MEQEQKNMEVTETETQQQTVRQMKQRYETAICFARMYGVRETLEPVAVMDNRKFQELALQWADRFLASGSGDMAAFFAGLVGEL